MSPGMSYETLICGATFAGIGMAVSADSSVLIVEPASSVGNDFIACLNPGDEWERHPRQAHGLSLRQDMIERNLLMDGGRVHLPGLYPLLCERIHRNKLHVRFLTDIVEVKQVQDGYEVTLHDTAGFTKVRARRVIDTTAGCLSGLHKKALPISKSINAYVDCAEPVEQLPDLSAYPNARIVRGRFDSEFIFKLQLSPDEDWPGARRKLNQFWESRPAALRAWRLTSIATAFEVQPPSPEHGSGDWSWRPSQAYANPLLAFDTDMDAVRGEELQ